MATVTSMTADKILELISGLEGIPDEQNALRSLISLLSAAVEANAGNLDEFNNMTLPELLEALGDHGVQIGDILENQIPNLAAAQEDIENAMSDLNTVILPSIQADVSSIGTDQPKVFNQPEPPTNDDLDYRDLQLGDTWFDTDDGNKQYMWDGVEWSAFSVDIPDLSLTVRKFNTTTHMIY